MVAADMDEGAGEGWGEDAALVIDEGTFHYFWELHVNGIFHCNVFN